MTEFYNNKITIRVILFLIFLFWKSGVGVLAQTTINGKVIDEESGEELIGANIAMTKNGVFIQGETTDIDGNFSISVDPGTYNLEASYTGYPTRKIEGIVASAGVSNKVEVKMKVGRGELVNWIGGCIWIVPLLKHDEMTNKKKIASEQIRNLPTRNVNEMILNTAGGSFSQ